MVAMSLSLVTIMVRLKSLGIVSPHMSLAFQVLVSNFQKYLKLAGSVSLTQVGNQLGIRSSKNPDSYWSCNSCFVSHFCDRLELRHWIFPPNLLQLMLGVFFNSSIFCLYECHRYPARTISFTFSKSFLSMDTYIIIHHLAFDSEIPTVHGPHFLGDVETFHKFLKLHEEGHHIFIILPHFAELWRSVHGVCVVPSEDALYSGM